LEIIFLVKILKFFDLNLVSGSGMEKFGSGSRMEKSRLWDLEKHSGSATLHVVGIKTMQGGQTMVEI
jgi:hypothetical protein